MTANPSGPPTPLSPVVESRPGLIRVLGPGMAMAMVVGNVIGSGIFFKPGEIARDAGDFQLIIIGWFVGGGVCILGALSFAELAVMLPRAGGLYVYLREAYGRPLAFLQGWTEFLFGKPASIGALSVAFVGAMQAVLNPAADDEALAATTGGINLRLVVEVLAALALIWGMAWVNIIGVIWGGRVQAGTTLIKAGFLAVIALLPFALMAGGNAGIDTANYATTVTPAKLTLTTQFAAVMLAVMWAYNGWHGVTPVAEEVRDPARNIPIALFGGIGLLILLYVSVNIAYHGVLTMEEMSQSGQGVAQAMFHKLFSPFGDNAAQAGVAVITAVIMCSTFGAINSNMLNGPRTSFAMGRDDVFFRQLGMVHVNYRTPAIAIVVQAGMSSILVIASGILVAYFESFRDRNIFSILTDYVVFSASIFYVLAVVAVFVLRVKHPEWERPYRTLGYPVLPAMYLVFYGWFLYHIFMGNPLESLIGMGLILIGLPVYYAWRSWALKHPTDLTDGQ